MLKKLGLENFKSWKGPVSLTLKPITILFGTNSSGKSAILKALLALKQTATSFDKGQALIFTDRDYVDLGSFRETVFGHDEESDISVFLSWSSKEEGQDTKILSVRRIPDRTGLRAATYQVIWELANDRVVITQLTYEAADFTLEMSRVREDQYSYVFVPSEAYKENNLVFSELFKLWQHEPPTFLSSPQSCYALPDEVEAIDLSLLQFNYSFEALIERITYLGPLREHPKRTYLWSGSAPHAIGKSGEQAIEALIAAERGGHSPGRLSLVSDVSNWLEQLGLASNLTVEVISKEKGFYEPRVRIAEQSEPVNIADAGFGVSQVLPVIVQLFLVPEYSIVLLEQPEIHLHPSAQSELADLFLEVAEKRHLQLIIETHSEYLLTRLQRRIAEAHAEFASPENIQLYFIELTGEGSQATEVRTNEFGEIENWPEGFFGDRIGDIDAMTQAGLERRLANLQDQPDE